MSLTVAQRRALELSPASHAASIRDQAMAMRLYAQQARNRQLEADALEIRLRAERRVGEMMETGKDDRQTRGGQGGKVSEKPTLSEAGIDKNLAHRARTLAGLAPERFEMS
jgi:hypothetical protein